MVRICPGDFLWIPISLTPHPNIIMEPLENKRRICSHYDYVLFSPFAEGVEYDEGDICSDTVKEFITTTNTRKVLELYWLQRKERILVQLEATQANEENKNKEVSVLQKKMENTKLASFLNFFTSDIFFGNDLDLSKPSSKIRFIVRVCCGSHPFCSFSFRKQVKSQENNKQQKKTSENKG